MVKPLTPVTAMVCGAVGLISRDDPADLVCGAMVRHKIHGTEYDQDRPRDLGWQLRSERCYRDRRPAL